MARLHLASEVLSAVSDPPGLAGHTARPELGGVRTYMLRDWTSSWVSFLATMAQEHLSTLVVNFVDAKTSRPQCEHDVQWRDSRYSSYSICRS